MKSNAVGVRALLVERLATVLFRLYLEEVRRDIAAHFSMSLEEAIRAIDGSCGVRHGNIKR